MFNPVSVLRKRRLAIQAARHLLDALANRADRDPAAAPDKVERVLLPRGRPANVQARMEVLELYKLMVSTSEALVTRRQVANTFFLTANGLLLTALGLMIGYSTEPFGQAGLVAGCCVTGLIVSAAWRRLLISFGQLNKGKFAVILRLEKLLAAAPFDAEWEALERGRDPRVYRSFTVSESRIPRLFMAIYVVAGVFAVLIATGVLPPL